MSKFKVNKYHFLAYLYFFFNSVGLAGGLLFTNLLTPVFYVWLFIKTKKPVLLPLFLVLIPFDIIHVLNGVDLKSFLVSNALFISTYVFVMSFDFWLRHYQETEELFKKILTANFAFTVLACIIYFTSFKEILWYKNKFTANVDDFYRLALLTFEASYYSLLFAPIATYYLLKVFFKLNTKPAINILILVLIPLFLSLSLGVLASMAISFAAIYIINWKKVFYKKNFFNILFLVLALMVFIIVALFIFFPENALFIRISNILSGVDTSTRGRTTESFGIAWKVANERSLLFGAGLGQVKILAFDIVKKYYNYWGDVQTVRIPNAVAETMAIFGLLGLIIRFGLIFYLFFKTKVLSNHYRTALFVMVFVYQFTGSYITNIVEYVIWVLAFSSTFKQFDRVKTS